MDHSLYSVEWSVRRHRHKLRSHSSSKLQSFARMPSHEMIAFPTISFLPASQIAQTRSATQLLTGFSHAMANRELARQAPQFYLMTAQKESNSSLTPALGCTYNSSARVLTEDSSALPTKPILIHWTTRKPFRVNHLPLNH